MSSAVIYARFSSSKQREASITDQLRVCREWCEREGHTVVREYTDAAISGRTDERPAFQQMVANAGEAQLCVVYMLDRFSRDEFDAPIYKKKLRDAGCRVVSAMEAMPDGPTAILLEKLYEGLAAVESAHIGERARRGMHGNALRCHHNGVRVYGYTCNPDGTYSVDEEQAAVVREVFARHAQGEPHTAIARDLAQRGVRTVQGNEPSYTFVHHIIDNEKYAGVYRFGQVRVEGGMPALVPAEEWAAAQRVKPRKQHATEHYHRFALAGRCICGECGRNYVGASANGNGGRYNYYRCGECKAMRPIRAERLEREVVRAVRGLLSSRSEAVRIAEQVRDSLQAPEAEARRDAAAKRLSKARATMDNLTQAVADGMPWASVQARFHAAEQAAEDAERELLIAAPVKFDVEDFADFLQFGAALDDERLLAVFVHSVVVCEGRAVAVLNVDNEKGEPATLDVDMVRLIKDWLPSGQPVRTKAVRGVLLVCVPLAA